MWSYNAAVCVYTSSLGRNSRRVAKTQHKHNRRRPRKRLFLSQSSRRFVSRMRAFQTRNSPPSRFAFLFFARYRAGDDARRRNDWCRFVPKFLLRRSTRNYIICIHIFLFFFFFTQISYFIAYRSIFMKTNFPTSAEKNAKYLEIVRDLFTCIYLFRGNMVRTTPVGLQPYNTVFVFRLVRA